MAETPIIEKQNISTQTQKPSIVSTVSSPKDTPANTGERVIAPAGDIFEGLVERAREQKIRLQNPMSE